MRPPLPTFASPCLAEWLAESMDLRPEMRVLDLGCGRAHGEIGIAGAGLAREITDAVPDHLRDWWTPDLSCLHSAGWWRQHWARTGIVDVTNADTMPDGWRRWLDWHRVIAPINAVEIEALEADRGEYVGYIRAVGRRRPDVQLEEAITSVATEYVRKPLLAVPLRSTTEEVG